MPAKFILKNEETKTEKVDYVLVRKGKEKDEILDVRMHNAEECKLYYAFSPMSRRETKMWLFILSSDDIYFSVDWGESWHDTKTCGFHIDKREVSYLPDIRLQVIEGIKEEQLCKPKKEIKRYQIILNIEKWQNNLVEEISRIYPFLRASFLNSKMSYSNTEKNIRTIENWMNSEVRFDVMAMGKYQLSIYADENYSNLITSIELLVGEGKTVVYFDG
ncbi:MAG: hypothetical protein QXT63_05945, partial [Thermoplasmata archaeon]